MEVPVTEAEAGAIKARLGSLRPDVLACIHEVSRAAFKLLNYDLPKIFGSKPILILEPDHATPAKTSTGSQRADVSPQ